MEDTICAISTSVGIGAISIVRVSGKDAIKIVNSIFSNDILNCESHTIKYGFIIDNEEKIDEVLLMIMKSPKTFTREDIVEINCHGGYSTTNRILEILLSHGCRLAEPGEFTKRAYLNGRINLLESEAINELIKANTDSQRKLSMNQIGGQLTKKINDIRDKLVSLMANIEVNIDYPEYTDNLVITEKLLNEQLSKIHKDLDELAEGARFGNIISNGINVAIVGKPNVGKSSLLNCLLDEQKAIVTNVAGTTRDIVEGKMVLNGIEVNLYDTAGIHDTMDIVERIGVNKSKNIIDTADVVVLVLDGSKELDTEDEELLKKCKDKNLVIFINKNDIGTIINVDDTRAIVGNTNDFESTKKLRDAILECMSINNINKDMTYLSNARQKDLVNKASESLKKALKGLNSNVPIDVVEIDVKQCFTYLGQIIGQSYDDEIINRLFQDFCVGK